jgi:hypothetical protein
MLVNTATCNRAFLSIKWSVVRTSFLEDVRGFDRFGFQRMRYLPFNEGKMSTGVTEE